jgi:cytochrome c peroxidase
MGKDAMNKIRHTGTARSRRNLATMFAIAGIGLCGLALAFSGSDLRGIGERLLQGAQHAMALFRGHAPDRAARDGAAASRPLPARRTSATAFADPDPMTTRDASGWLRTFTRSGAIDHDNTFFQAIGSNGRSCETCHRQSAAWSITPAQVQALFASTDGTDPIFRPVDGSNSPLADVSTRAARRVAYSMLLNRGVIRVGIGIPAGAEFVLDAVDDPYHYASAAELSLFRRPLPATNLAYLTAIMWDGRETQTPFLPPMHAGQDNDALVTALIKQASDATKGHAQGIDPTPEQLADIVAFESGLSTAQIRDDVAGLLNEGDAIGGPRILANQRFYVGINDTLGADPTGSLFDPAAMGMFGAWTNADLHDSSARAAARAAIARGEALFNDKPLTITGVAGLNDALGLPSIAGTCSTCHDSPNVGNHSVALPLNIGLADASRRTPDMPLYTLRNTATGETVQTTDPGLALITGKWKDIGKFKGPVLRALAARAPYFHNGSAARLEDVVDFYDTRFAMQLSPAEKQDLVAFLKAL